jgi:hypothetical protein
MDHLHLLAFKIPHRYPLDEVSLIGNICSKTFITFINLYFEQTQLIPIARGTIQGNILNPYLFLDFSWNTTLLVKERINYIYYCNIFDTCTNSIPYANYLISYPRLERLNNWTMEFRIAKCTLGNAPYKTKTDIVDCFLPNPLLFS